MTPSGSSACFSHPLDDPSQLLSLCFSPRISDRTRALRTLAHSTVPPNVLVPVLLGLMKDPYPLVRRAALEGLCGICVSGNIVVDGIGVVEGCYWSAVGMIRDGEECVRVSAVRAVTEWGIMLIDSKDGEDKRDCTDHLFLLLCSIVRDMSVSVRLEGFYSLGKIKQVSEGILLQSLSKRILSSLKGKKPLSRCSAKSNKLRAFSAAGAFVHGLEDECSEVRRAACISLRGHISLSSRFADEAVTLLLDVQNDDSELVRLEVLEALHHVIKCDDLKMQQVLTQMNSYEQKKTCAASSVLEKLFRSLADRSPQIRVGALKILGAMKIATLQSYKLSVESLLDGLEQYPQNEAEFLLALFESVRINGGHAVSIIQDICHKVRSACDKLDFDEPQAIGLLVMALSASLYHEECLRQIPESIFSYQAVYFGRISAILGDVVNKDALLNHLCCSRGLEHASKDKFQTETEGSSLNTDVMMQGGSIGTSSLKASDGDSENWSLSMCTKCQQLSSVESWKSIKLSFKSIKISWELIKSGSVSEALNLLRSCKEEFKSLTNDSLDFASISVFGLRYICLIKSLAKLWEYCELSQKYSPGMGQVDVVLVKSLRALLELRYRFSGLSKDDELYLIELELLIHVLKLVRFQICCRTVKKLIGAVSRAVHMCDANSLVPSELIRGLAKLSQVDTGSITKLLCSPLHLMKLLESCSLKDFAHLDKIRHKKAELLIPGYDAENPFTFIPGLPVGVTLEVSLYNATSEDRLWIKLSLDEFSEFVYLDNDVQDCEEVVPTTITAVFYGTPNAGNFRLRIIVGVECLSEDLSAVKHHGGPKYPLIYLSSERVVYFMLHSRGARIDI
ncbi:SIEL-like protein [Drosera capensis]